MKRFAAYIAALALAVSCIYPYSPDLDDMSEVRLVIDGDIVLGGISRFEASSTMPLGSHISSKDPHPLLDAFFWIEDSEGDVYPKGYDQINPVYSYHNAIDTEYAPLDRQYRVHCKVPRLGEKKDLEYVSEWESVAESPSVTEMDYSYDSKSVFVNLSVSEGAPYFKWDFTETWQYKTPYETRLVFDPGTGQITEGDPPYAFYVCWKSEASKVFGLGSYMNQSTDALLNQRLCQIPRNYNRLSFADRFSVRVCGISEDAYRYLDNLLTVSSLTGSLFSPSPEDMRGNITNVNDREEFVIGYVSVVKPTTYTYYLIPEEGLYTPDKRPELFVPNTRQYDLSIWFRMGYVPVMEDIVNQGGEDVSTVLWGAKRCVDCREQGGIIVKPVDWPL